MKQAYLEMAKQHHPDAGGCKSQFQRISEAYEVLTGGATGTGVRSAAEQYEEMMKRRAKEPLIVRSLFRCGGSFWQFYGAVPVVAVVVVAAVVEDQRRPNRRR